MKHQKNVLDKTWQPKYPLFVFIIIEVKRNAYRILVQNQKVRDHWEDQNVRG
jgi:hypothetical protein